MTEQLSSYPELNDLKFHEPMVVGYYRTGAEDIDNFFSQIEHFDGEYSCEYCETSLSIYETESKNYLGNFGPLCSSCFEYSPPELLDGLGIK